jgi:hypothetical protein
VVVKPLVKGAFGGRGATGPTRGLYVFKSPSDTVEFAFD